MTITQSSIVWKKSALTSDTTPAQNGGRLSQTNSPAGVRGNIFPGIQNSQRVSGVVLLRKLFIKIETANPETLLDPKIFIAALSAGDDYLTLRYTGSQTDTQDQLGNARHYGIGTLQESVAQGATQLRITLEHSGAAALQPFRPGDLLRVSNKTDSNPAGEEEYVSVDDASDAVVTSGGEVTLLVSPTTLAWTVGGTVPVLVSSCIQPGDVSATYSAFAVHSAAGTYSDTANLIPLPIGAVCQTWTVTITDPATGTFRLDGDTLGSGVASGQMGSSFRPVNPDTLTPYFTISASGWGGDWALNDSMTFTTSPAAVPVWYQQNIPANAASIAASTTTVTIDGECQ
ncbi:MAG: hypothetical protein HQM06_16680 [Magnetococcales bacterium]|nr:hypothetical protein [Magnetococcales bacterium]